MLNLCPVARVALCVLLVAPLGVAGASSPAGSSALKRGRYLVMIGGCNDCHTEGFASRGGHVPEKDWLTGSRLGFRGPWGTTYPPNLRLLMQSQTRDEWIAFAHHSDLRPPMPNWALHTMTSSDLGAIYAFIRKLGPAGKPAPAFVPPGQAPQGPVVTWPAPDK